MSDKTNKLLSALDENPELLLKILNSDNDAVNKGVSGVTGNTALIDVLGTDVTMDDLKDAENVLENNPVVQLYLASAGSLDLNDLTEYVGGVSGTRAGLGVGNLAVRALFDGKLDLKDIILVIVLLKLFKRKNNNTFSNSAIGLFGSLMGLNNSNNSGLFSGLFGGNNYSSGLFGNSYNTGLFGNSQSSGLGGLLGLGNSSSSYNNNVLSNLINFVNGGYNSNPQYNSIWNVLNGASTNVVGSNGLVSSSGLFSVLSQLLGF